MIQCDMLVIPGPEIEACLVGVVHRVVHKVEYSLGVSVGLLFVL